MMTHPVPLEEVGHVEVPTLLTQLNSARLNSSLSFRLRTLTPSFTALLPSLATNPLY